MDKAINIGIVFGWLYILGLILMGCGFTEMYDGSAAL